ncbi:MAG: hypothetical protein IJ020_01450 [Bacteroidaceae bacterium]|nr:hypothetical protein [Bacteroidaceae bacterium]
MVVFLVAVVARTLYILLLKTKNPLLFAILFFGTKRDKIEKKTSPKQTYADNFSDFSSEVGKLHTSVFTTSHVRLDVFTLFDERENGPNRAFCSRETPQISALTFCHIM